MKRSHEIAAVSAIALAFLGVAHHRAQATEQTAPIAAVTELVTGAPSPQQEAELSEHGLSAMNDIHLARMAVNDGYVQSAKKLLGEAQKLLAEVKKEDHPVTVTTDIKVGGKDVEHDSKKERLDLIPIMSELQVVEGFDTPTQKPAIEAPQATDSTQTTEAKTPGATPAPATSDAKADEQAAADHAKARATAIAKARDHLRTGDRKAAIEDLKLEDLTLISKLLSLPLTETSAHVDKAVALLDQGKLHEANLELKKVQDALVLSATVVHEPTDQAQQGQATSKAG